jgi:hypothetical protein
VIALNDGGTKETVIHKVTGIHFEEQTQESILDAITEFEKIDFNYENIRKEATKYTHFEKELLSFITKIY